MSFELSGLNNVVDEIESLWEKLGLSSDEKEEEKKSLDMKVMNVFIDLKNILEERYNKLEMEIKATIEKHIELLEGFGDTEEKIQNLKNNNVETSKQNLEIIRNNFENDKEKYQKALYEIENIRNESKLYLGLLGIERDEFKNFDEIKFTDEIIQNYKLIIEELSLQVKEKQKLMLSLNQNISELSSELELEIPSKIVQIFMSNSLSNDSINLVTEYHKSLEEQKNQRIQDIQKMARKIKSLWRILDIPNEGKANFINSYSTLGQSVVDSCKNELKRLKAMRKEKLLILIESQNEEIYELCNYIQIEIPEPTINTLELETEKLDELEGFYKTNQKNICKLREQKESCDEIITLINKREENINETEALKNSTNPKDEQIRRRNKALLKKQERELYIKLFLFKEQNKYDFEWDGQPYVNNLPHIILSDFEKKNALARERKKSIRSKSLGYLKVDSNSQKSRNSEGEKKYPNLL